MGLFEEYVNKVYPTESKYENGFNKWRNDFLSDFPMEDINTIPIKSFLFSKKGTGNSTSFCNRLWNNKYMASLGDSFPSIFGIYYADGKTLKLSSTFINLFNDDFDSAYLYIRNEIVNVLKAGIKGDLEYIANSKLSSPFKCLILATYFIDKYIPAPTKTALDAYCNSVNISFNKNENPIYRNAEIVEWMHNVPEMDGWDAWRLMRFCDWLWRQKKAIDGSKMTGDTNTTLARKINSEISVLNLVGQTKDAVVKVRVNQGAFRDLLLNRYDHCCLCGVSDTSLLIASHIKPWAVSEDNEKLDVNNGFLMCPNHDKLFDQGYISFDETGKIMISSQLNPNDKIFMNIHSNMKINLTENNKKYLEYHRSNIYLG